MLYSYWKPVNDQENRSIPKLFYNGTRKCQTLHARRRLECSSLNTHLYSWNIAKNLDCTCGGTETTQHVFSTINTNQRRLYDVYLNALPYNTNTETLLFGDNNLSYQDNLYFMLFINTSSHQHLPILNKPLHILNLNTLTFRRHFLLSLHFSRLFFSLLSLIHIVVPLWIIDACKMYCIKNVFPFIQYIIFTLSICYKKSFYNVHTNNML